MRYRAQIAGGDPPLDDSVEQSCNLGQTRRWPRESGDGKAHRETACSKRTIPLLGQLVHALEDHQVRQDKERVAAGSLRRDSPWVFTTPVGTPIDPRNDYREFKKLLGKAGLPPVRLHDFRHTAASSPSCSGRAARAVMEILGHSPDRADDAHL